MLQNHCHNIRPLELARDDHMTLSTASALSLKESRIEIQLDVKKICRGHFSLDGSQLHYITDHAESDWFKNWTKKVKTINLPTEHGKGWQQLTKRAPPLVRSSYRRCRLLLSLPRRSRLTIYLPKSFGLSGLDWTLPVACAKVTISKQQKILPNRILGLSESILQGSAPK